MVLKVSKHGVRTGNSFKCRKYNGHYKQYRKQAVIVRDIAIDGDQIDRDKENVLGDIDVRSSRIPYSINKKGRWELPDIIKSSIEDGDFDDKAFAVQLVEYHKILNKNNCLSIHTSKCPNPRSWKENQKIRESKGGYLNSRSLLAPRYDNLTRRERLRRRYRDIPLDEEEEEPVVNTSSVRYQVIYPPSPTSCLSYTPRFTGYSSDHSERNAGYCRYARGGRNLCTRRPAYGKKFLKEIMDEMTYGFEDESETDYLSNSDEGDFEGSRINRENNVLLTDMICKPKVKNTRLRKRRHSSSTKSDTSDGNTESSHIVYEKVTSPTTSSKPQEDVAIVNETRTVQSVLVSLPNEDTDRNTLKHKYSTMYTECTCYPRKFIIDISDKVKAVCPPGTSRQNEQITCVVFALDKDNEMNNEKESIYKVTINTLALKSLGHCKIETLFDYMETTLEECLHRTVFYLETLPEFMSNANSPSTTFHKPKKQRSSNIEKCANWESDSYVPNPEFHYSEYLTSLMGHIDMDETSSHINCMGADITKSTSGINGRVCDICYELLGGQVPGTALVSCGHWFCDPCWAEYLEGRVNAGTTTLTCPEFDCDKVVDPGTAVSLLNLRDVIRHAKCRHDTEVESGDNTKWCPNVHCGRVLKVKSIRTKIANCVCGQVFCFDCGRQPHWPASCEAFTNYFKRLEETGDIGLAPVESLDRVIVNGKNCPHCKKFIEKGGGCPFMACVCGGSFCWGCGRDWNSNRHENSCYRHGYRNEHDTYEMTLEDDRLKINNKKAKWYNIAVKHRAEQHVFKVDKMKSARKNMVLYLSNFISRSAKKGTSVSLEFEGQKSVYRHEQDKLLEYLNEMIELHQELNRLVENTAVMMDSEKLPPNKAIPIHYITNRMASFAEGIFKGFSQGLFKNPEDLLTLFKKVRVHSYRTIKSLVNLVRKLEL